MILARSFSTRALSCSFCLSGVLVTPLWRKWFQTNAAYVQSLKGQLELHFLSGYAPDLNPDESASSMKKMSAPRRLARALSFG